MIDVKPGHYLLFRVLDNNPDFGGLLCYSPQLPASFRGMYDIANKDAMFNFAILFNGLTEPQMNILKLGQVNLIGVINTAKGLYILDEDRPDLRDPGGMPQDLKNMPAVEWADQTSLAATPIADMLNIAQEKLPLEYDQNTQSIPEPQINPQDSPGGLGESTGPGWAFSESDIEDLREYCRGLIYGEGVVANEQLAIIRDATQKIAQSAFADKHGAMADWIAGLMSTHKNQLDYINSFMGILVHGDKHLMSLIKDAEYYNDIMDNFAYSKGYNDWH